MTRHIRWQVLLILLGVVLVGILLTYLAFNYTIVLRPGYGGTYVEGVVGSPHYLNPLLSGYSDADRDICALVFGGLMRLNAQGEVEGDLAREWEVTLDGLTYTFHLRPGVRWHDGEPLTADDVIFTINLLKDADFPGPPEAGAALWRTVTVEKVNRLTVRFMLTEPYAPFLDYTTIGILPEHLLQGVRAADLTSAEFNLKPVGSGPFQVETVDIEDGVITSIVLKPSPYYYGPQPHLGRLQLRFYPSSQAALNAYEAGEVKGVSRIPLADLPRASTFPELNLFSAQFAEYGVVFLNLANPDLPFFQDVEVRQAMMYALDRQQIIDGALGGQALVARSPLIPGTWAYSETLKYEQDFDRANALLRQAGWRLPRGGSGGTVREKEGQQLAFTLLTSSEPERVAVAQMLVEQWATVGFTITVEMASPVEVREALESRSFDAVLIHLALPGDPDPYPFWHQRQVEGGQNYAGFDHRYLSEVIEQARVVVNRERRQQLYDEFQRVFAEEVPAVVLYVPVYTYGVDAHIYDVQIGPLVYPSDRFRTIADWWIVPRRVFVSEAEVERP